MDNVIIDIKLKRFFIFLSMFIPMLVFSQNVGVGTTSPGEKLEIFGGGIKADSIQLINGANSGYVLQSKDGNGNAQWIDPTTISGINGATGPTGPLVSGTLGQTLYHNGTLWSATSNLYHDNTNVGVGLSSPSATFHIDGNFKITAGPPAGTFEKLKVDYDVGGDTYMLIKDGNQQTDFQFKTEGDSYLNGNGNVGVGSTSPLAKLHVTGGGNSSGSDAVLVDNSNGDEILKIRDDGVVMIANNTDFRIQSESAGGFRLLGEQGNTPDKPSIGFFSTNGIDDGGGGMGIYRPLANEMAFSTQSLERMRIKPGGKIGINTSSPTTMLHIAGGIRIEDELFDAGNSAGNSGNILQSTGTGTKWVSSSVINPAYLESYGIGATKQGVTLSVNQAVFFRFIAPATGVYDEFFLRQGDQPNSGTVSLQVAVFSASGSLLTGSSTFNVNGNTGDYSEYFGSGLNASLVKNTAYYFVIRNMGTVSWYSCYVDNALVGSGNNGGRFCYEKTSVTDLNTYSTPLFDSDGYLRKPWFRLSQ